MNKAFRFILGVFVLLLLGSWQVPGTSNCSELVKKYFAKSRELSSPASGKTYYLEAEMSTINKPTARQPDISLLMKFIINKKNFQYESEQVSIYEDKVFSYTVIHPKKLVIKNNVVGNKAKSQQLGNFIGMQNAMLEYAQNTSCNELTNKNGDKLIEIKLILNGDGQEMLKAKQVILYIEKDSYSIRKSIIYYVDNHPIYTQTVNFRKISYDFKDFSPLGPNQALFEKNGKFKRKYQGFTLVDNTQNIEKK